MPEIEVSDDDPRIALVISRGVWNRIGARRFLAELDALNPARQPVVGDAYLIQAHDGTWFRRPGDGTTENVQAAHRYTREEADAAVKRFGGKVVHESKAPPVAPAQSSEANDNPDTLAAITFTELVAMSGDDQDTLLQRLAGILQKRKDNAETNAGAPSADRIAALEARIAALETQRAEKDQALKYALQMIELLCRLQRLTIHADTICQIIKAAFPEPKP